MEAAKLEGKIEVKVEAKAEGEAMLDADPARTGEKGKSSSKMSNKAGSKVADTKEDAIEKQEAASSRTNDDRRPKTKKRAARQKEPSAPAGARAPPNTYDPKEESGDVDPSDAKPAKTASKNLKLSKAPPNTGKKSNDQDSDEEESSTTAKPVDGSNSAEADALYERGITGAKRFQAHRLGYSDLDVADVEEMRDRQALLDKKRKSADSED